MDFLKSAVASAVARGPLAAYSVQERVDVDNSIWTLNNAVKRDNNARCTVFGFDVAANKARLPLAKNAVRKARTLHHPGVVKVIETIETDTQIYICTERVTPLSWFTKRKSLAEGTSKWGLCSVAKTIKFINEEAASIHGSVRTSSIFVNDSGEWKVGGFELLSSIKEEDAVIYLYGGLVPDAGRYAPPEVGKGGWDAMRNSSVSAADSYGFGTLTYECFNGFYPGSDHALQVRDIPPTMQQAYKRLMNPNPKLRLSVSHFLEQGRRNGGFFQTPLINLSNSLDSLGLKSEGERDEFLAELSEVADQYPEEYMKRRVLPELLKSVEFGGGGAKVFSVVLKIGSKLSSDEYEAQLVPVLVRLFSSPDRAIRVCLLENLPLMIDHMSNKIVNDKVFPNLVTGFTDAAPLVREQTVKSVLIIITKLSDRTINGELLKYLAKTANDAEPGIRTNTVICLGKIARQLGQSSRSKVLIAAFSRSLKDPFVHARNAALLALTATADVFTDDDCATKILPALCPSLLDKERSVRDQANKTLNAFLTRVRKAADALPDAPASENGVSGASVSNSAANTPGTASPRGPTSSRSTPAPDPSWAAWAISSWTKTSSTAANANDLRPETPKATGTLRPAQSPLHEHRSDARDGPRVVPAVVEPAVEDDNDGWGFDPEQEESWTAEQDHGTNGFEESTEEPDFAAWLAAKQTKHKMPVKANLPKGPGPRISSRPAPARSATTSSALATRKVVVKPAPKPAAKKEPEGDDEEDWGAAWD